MRNQVMFFLIAVVTAPSLAGEMWVEPATTQPATSPAVAALPPQIEQLRAAIQKMHAAEILREIEARFDVQDHYLGSGVHIRGWDVGDGRLIFHPGRGPTYWDAQGRKHWLIDTKNRAGEHLATSFEMATLPDPANHGTMYWIGNLSISRDLTYHFTDSGANKNDRGDQSKNFFMRHPVGTVKVTWSDGVSADTLLESLEAGTVATLTFRSEEGDATSSLVMQSSPEARSISLSAPDAPFRLSSGWKKFFADEATEQ